MWSNLRKFMMRFDNDPVWKKILKLLYRTGPNGSFFAPGDFGFFDGRHVIAEELGIDGTELGNNLNFLKEQGLIGGDLYKQNPREWNVLSLTSEGFNVVLQGENIRNNQRNQSTILIFTIILALATTWQVFRIAFPAFIGDVAFASSITVLLGTFTLYTFLDRMVP